VITGTAEELMVHPAAREIECHICIAGLGARFVKHFMIM
jgi:hypothetical protein